MLTSIDIKRQSEIFNYLESLPYNVNRRRLYDASSLYAGFDPEQPDSFADCFDSRVYHHFLATGKRTLSVEESLARTLHDNGIHADMNCFLHNYSQRDCIGIMGGHGLLRTDPMYRAIVLISKRLTELGALMLSGGGPGAMEATHLGAWLAGRSENDVNEAQSMLTPFPSYSDDGWLSAAFHVMDKYPRRQEYVSLGIPTWLYGHEPSTPFATHIAKFFENSLREDSILTLAYGGIIYAPGSAGTMQEIFQDAVQNHYLSFGFSSPMIFLGRRFWTEEMPAYTLLDGLMKTGKYQNLLLTLSDNSDEIIEVLERFRLQQS